MLRVAMRQGCAVWPVAFAAAAWAQQTPPAGTAAPAAVPTIPTPSELGAHRLEIDSDPARLPKAGAAPRQLARPDEDIRIDIVRYEVAGDAPEPLRARLAALTGPYVGAGRTFDDMADAAREVTRFLQSELGYYLGYAYIPEQEPGDGVIRIAVLEGRLDAVELVWKDGLPVRRDVVEAHLARLKPGAVLLVRDVERVVFLVNDLRGLTADFEVQPGATPGTARLVVTPRATPPTTWQLTGDNANSRFLGTARGDANVVRNSPLGIGDSVTANLIASKGLEFVLGNYSAPVGSAGFRAGLSLSALQYEVDKKAFPQGLKGTAGTLSAFGLYPAVRSRNLNLFVVGSADLKSYRDFDGATFNPKRVVTAGLGVTGDLRDSVLGGGINSLDAQLGSGHIRFAVPPAIDAPKSNFTKLTLRAVRLQNILAERLQFYGAVRLQKSLSNLDITEQFRAGGPDGVRAFPTGEGSGDNGAQVTGELRLIPPAGIMQKIGGAAYLSLFADRAVVLRRNDVVGQDPTFVNRLTYAGYGLALTWSGPHGWDLRGSIARPTEGEAANEADRSDRRVFVQASKQF